jgi:hypothetical protein
MAIQLVVLSDPCARRFLTHRAKRSRRAAACGRATDRSDLSGFAAVVFERVVGLFGAALDNRLAHERARQARSVCIRTAFSQFDAQVEIDPAE